MLPMGWPDLLGRYCGGCVMGHYRRREILPDGMFFCEHDDCKRNAVFSYSPSKNRSDSNLADFFCSEHCDEADQDCDWLDQGLEEITRTVELPKFEWTDQDDRVMEYVDALDVSEERQVQIMLRHFYLLGIRDGIEIGESDD